MTPFRAAMQQLKPGNTKTGDYTHPPSQGKGELAASQGGCGAGRAGSGTSGFAS